MTEEESSVKALQEERNRVIIRTSLIGIAANLFLAAFKAVTGLISHSIAVVLDAVNNLSDALSSVITIIGTKLASRKPDAKHPLGHGRIEYLSAMVVAAFVLYAGITSLVESVRNILHPDVPDYSPAALVIIASAVAVKLLLGRYVKKTGERVNSGSLVASGSDALFDAILSASVLLSAVIFLLFHVSLEAWVGVLISVFIIRSGMEMLSDTVDEILGKRLDRDYLESIRRTICEDDDVFGAYDLILHSYGPERYIGSVHVEVPDTLTAEQIDLMERRIADRVYRKHGVALAGIGIYSHNTKSDEVREMRSDITRLVMSEKGVIQMHGFYVDLVSKTINFDVILDFELPDRFRTFCEIGDRIRSAYPDYELHMTMDSDI